MYLSPLNRLLIAVILALLSWSTAVFAAATVTVLPAGDLSYTVQGAGMDGVSGIQLDITYDAASLSAPTVNQGALVAGAMLAANSPRPGLVKIAIISTRSFSGSGQIATITFASRAGSGGITSVTSSMIDSSGAALASSAASTQTGESSAPGTITSPGIPFSQPSQTATTSGQQQTTTASSTAAASATTSVGTVTLPSEQQQLDPVPAASPAVPGQTGEPAAVRTAEAPQVLAKPAADAKIEETAQYVVYKGVLDRFRLYNGSKKLPSMAALFDKKIAQSITQEPALLSSDGQGKATLTVDIPARISSSPNFAVNGGTLVSFTHDKQTKGRWIVVVLPEAGSVKVTLTIIAGTEEFEFPLTVVPPIKTALPLNEHGWDRFVKEAGTPAAPLHDFNSDGVRDYLDEYIFVANYLVTKAAPAKPVPSPKKTVK